MNRVTIVKDEVDNVFKAIRELVGQQVLVGIPESTTSRDEEGSGVTNATLGYIHEYGSPSQNIPARPFLIPGVEKSREDVLVPLKKAAESVLSGDSKKTAALLNAAGTIAESSVKLEINTGNFVPLKPATIRARRYGRNTQSMRAAEKNYLALIAGGMSPADVQSAAGIRPLVNTGALRNSITHVVRKK